MTGDITMMKRDLHLSKETYIYEEKSPTLDMRLKALFSLGDITLE